MTYRETLAWMFRQLPMYQRQGKSAFKKDLTNIKAFVAELQNPEKKFKSVHVAGTNGKGSVCHILASILQEAGYKTGLYTSPHLKDFRERIRINGKMVSEGFVVEFIQNHKAFFEEHNLSFFEMSVGMAFRYFEKEKVDIAIVETGLGGRLDSTNILLPELSIITHIGLDHTKFLGETLPEIAAEKAGIIKPKTPVVIGQEHEQTAAVFKKKAKATHSPLFFAENNNYADYNSELKGNYQKHNLRTVLKSVEVLQDQGWLIKPKHIAKGLQNITKNTGLRGRWQQLGISPKIICDTAHNKDGLECVLIQLETENYKTLHIVLGTVNDKDLGSLLPLFPKGAVYYFCEPNVPRGMPVQKLASTAKDFGLKGKAFNTVKAAFKASETAANPEDLVFIGGSTFTVAEVL